MELLLQHRILVFVSAACTHVSVHLDSIKSAYSSVCYASRLPLASCILVTVKRMNTYFNIVLTASDSKAVLIGKQCQQ
jgi:hypothetical protein